MVDLDTMSFTEARALSDAVNAEVVSAAAVVGTFPRTSSGLPPEEVRLSAEYREAKETYRLAFTKLRNFNAVYTKLFVKELRSERDKRKIK